MTKDIDQRAQRSDPANKHTEFPDQRPDSTKQPGGVASEGGDSVVAPVAEGKYNTRDDGPGHAVDDAPVKHIKDSPKGDE